MQSHDTSLLFGHFAEVQEAVHIVKLTQCAGGKKCFCTFIRLESLIFLYSSLKPEEKWLLLNVSNVTCGWGVNESCNMSKCSRCKVVKQEPRAFFFCVCFPVSLYNCIFSGVRLFGSPQVGCKGNIFFFIKAGVSNFQLFVEC